MLVAGKNSICSVVLSTALIVTMRNNYGSLEGGVHAFPVKAVILLPVGRKEKNVENQLTTKFWK